MNRMDDIGLSDNQRSMAVKLSDKLRKLFGAYQRQSQHLSSRAGSEDARQQQSGDQRLGDQIVGLENDSADLFKRLSDSLVGQTSVKLSSLAHPTDSGSEGDDYYDRTKKRKKPAGSANLLPSTKEGISQELSRLYQLRDECLTRLEGLKDPTENSPSDDDPFEAFMASTEKEVVDHTASEERSKLKSIEEGIARLEESKRMMDMYAFTDPSYQKPLKSKPAHVPASDDAPSVPKGKGTVWESEFAKDETVPTSRGTQKLSRFSQLASVPISLNARQGGLQFVSREQAEVHRGSSVSQTEANEAREEALRKKLGY